MLNQLIKKILLEATSDSSGGRGSYVSPLQLGVREFSKVSLQPFTTPVSNYINAELEYDSYDGKMSTPKKKIKKMENKVKKISNYIKNNPMSTFSDEDGNNINQTPGGKKSIVPITTLKEWIEIKKDTVVVGEKKVIKLNENDLIKIVKRVLTEQTAPKGKVLNLFCQSKNNSFRESGLTLDSEEDMYGGLNGGGLKRIFLTPSPTIPRESYEPSTVILDVVPAAKMNKDFLEKSKMTNPNQKIYLISNRISVNHFCSIDAGTDKEWADYLNKL